MTKPERDKQREMREAFYSIFAEIDPDTPEEVDEIIRAAGIDPDAYATKIRKLAKNTIAEQARRQIVADHQQYDRTANSTIEERKLIVQTIQKMLSMLDSKKSAAFAHYRNMESASDADLKSLLNDLTYLTEYPEQEYS